MCLCLCRHCVSALSPVCAITGGILAQEIIKAVSQRDAPHNNFFFYNGLESSGMVDRIAWTWTDIVISLCDICISQANCDYYSELFLKMKSVYWVNYDEHESSITVRCIAYISWWVFLRHCLARFRMLGYFYWSAAEPLADAHGTLGFRGTLEFCVTPVENHCYTVSAGIFKQLLVLFVRFILLFCCLV